jgi:hypothetical protein
MSDPVADLNHRCRAAIHCVGRVPVTEGDERSYVGAITPGPDTLCNGCVKRIQTQLEQLPHLSTALRSFLGTSMTAALGSKVNSTPTPSAPINLRNLDLIDQIQGVIDRAGGSTVQISDLVGKPVEEFTIGGRIRPLDGVDRALAIGAVWRKADGVVGLGRTWQKRNAPCPRCGLACLGGFLGEDTIHCTNSSCAKSFPWDQYQSLCLAKFELEKLEEKGKIK